MGGLQVTDQNDPLAGLMGALARRNGPWHWQENPETGAIAIYPKTATDIEAWQARSLDMHSRQETLILAPKPVHNDFSRPQIVRGD